MRFFSKITINASDLKEYIEKDVALARRFQPIYVTEPTTEGCIAILRGLKDLILKDKVIMSRINKSFEWEPTKDSNIYLFVSFI